ncbi:serine/threonine-protein phosphatase 4 regulatory subunit 1-like [Saccoglossus kowalevskii]
MADILLVGSEGGFESDDYETEDVNMFTSALDATTQDELLSPLAKLEKYIDSDNVFNR